MSSDPSTPEVTPKSIGAARTHAVRFCQTCEKKGKRNDTVGYCKNCMRYLCESCHSSHLHAKLTKHHVLFDWKSRTKSFKLTKPKPPKPSDDAFTIACEKHPGKVIDYVCLVHDEVICSVCAIGAHTDCDPSNIKHIPKLSPGVDDTDDYKDVLRDLISMIQKSQTLVKGVNVGKTKAKDYSTKVAQDVNKFRKQLNDASEELEKEMLNQIVDARQEDHAKLDACIQRYQHVCEEVEKFMSRLQMLRHNKRHNQLFVMMKMANACMAPLKHILDNPEETMTMQYQFQPECDTFEMLKREGALGKLTRRVSTDINVPSSVKEKIMVFENTANISDSAPTQFISIPIANGSQVATAEDDADGILSDDGVAENGELSTQESVVESDYEGSPTADEEEPDANVATDISVASRSDCYPVSVSSTALLPDNNLVVIDMGNWKIKLLDTHRNKLIQELSELGCPWDITNLPENEVAITFPILKRIMIYKYDIIFSSVNGEISHKGLTKEREINVRGYCYGIAYTNDKIIVTCAPDWLLGEGPAKVEILNMKGHVLQKIMSDDEGERLFYDPKYVTVTEDAKTLFLSDWGDDSVTSLVVETSTISTYEDDKLRTPGKISMDSNGSMYICGQGSNNVHRITGDNTGLQIMLSDNGLVAPRAISVAEGQGVIYVGMIGSDIIKTFHVL